MKKQVINIILILLACYIMVSKSEVCCVETDGSNCECNGMEYCTFPQYGGSCGTNDFYCDCTVDGGYIGAIIGSVLGFFIFFAILFVCLRAAYLRRLRFSPYDCPTENTTIVYAQQQIPSQPAYDNAGRIVYYQPPAGTYQQPPVMYVQAVNKLGVD